MLQGWLSSFAVLTLQQYKSNNLNDQFWTMLYIFVLPFLFMFQVL